MSAKEKTQKTNEAKAGKAEENQQGVVREYAESLIVAIILALIVKTFVLQTFEIPTGSMEDGLLVGDHLVVNKMLYGAGESTPFPLMPIREIERGDVVIFKYPANPRVDYIKRVIGLPGETVKIYDHQIFINDVPIEDLGMDEDKYTLQWRNRDSERVLAFGGNDNYIPSMDPEAKRLQKWEVPEGHYFMMGDHRFVSQDSRTWGFVSRDKITGRGEFIYWSFDADRQQYKETDFIKQVGNFFGTVVSFPFKTRWDRFFRIIT
jgi:signal peptidase I